MKPLESFDVKALVRENSLEAFRGLDRETQKKAILSAIRSNPGITRQELCPKVGMAINAVSGRVAELLMLGRVFEGEEPDRSSGRARGRLFIDESHTDAYGSTEVVE